MKKLIFIMVVPLYVIFSSFSSNAMYPVFDATRAADFIQQMSKIKEQISTLKSQLSQAQQMYQSVTGTRNFGDLLRNTGLIDYLPDDMKTIYNSLSGNGFSGISGSISDILDSEEFTGAIDTAQKLIEKRSRETAATDKAVGLKAYDGAKKRLQQIESLMDRINTTNDEKGIEELQARIAGEQAAIENEMTKLAMISQLQEAEQRLISEQKKELNRRILNSENTGMPEIR